MKPSDLPKDKRDSVRINTKVDAALRAQGMSTQKLFDWAVDQRVKMNMNMKIKEEKPSK